MRRDDGPAVDLDRRGYRTAAWVGIGILAAGIVVAAAMGRWFGVLTLMIFLAAAIGFMLARHRLPSLFDLLFVVAAVVNAAGWVANIWTVPGYDEAVHAYTSFALTLALGFVSFYSVRMHFRGHGALFVLTVASLGLAVGALWEVFEWALAMPHNNPGMDLLMDAVGALAAGLLAAWLVRHESRVRGLAV